MKRTFVWLFCLAIIVLLMPTDVQAKELREVSASEILKQIENGEDIFLENVSITGELDLCEIELENVPISRTEWEIEYVGLEEKLKIVESEIAIINSVFENDVGFSYTQFIKDIDISRTTFLGEIDFRGADFCGDANIEDAIFNGDADFRHANFTGYAGFRDTNFAGNAYFGCVSFAGDADFCAANFGNDVNFLDAIFRVLHKIVWVSSITPLII